MQGTIVKNNNENTLLTQLNKSIQTYNHIYNIQMGSMPKA
jgi:hypothetical protein